MKITIDREVLMRAKVALEQERDNYHDVCEEDGAPEYIHESIAAIKDALEQPQQEPVPPELFAQQIAAAMRFADAPLSEAQAVTLVLYLKARAS